MDVGTNRTVAAMALCALVLTGLAGCGSEDPGDGAARAGTPSSSAPPKPPPTSASPTPLKPTPADGTNIKKCFDGTCEIAVNKPVGIAIDKRLGISRVEIEKITAGESVTLILVSPLNDYNVVATPGRPNTVNKITVVVKEIKGKRAVLAISAKSP